MSTPTVAPMLAYRDGQKALEWLPAAFGCTVRNTYIGDDGSVGHAEFVFDDGIVMIAGFGEPYEPPNDLQRNYPPAAKWYDHPYIVNGVFVQIDDVDAHYNRAVAAGAQVLSPPEDTDHGRVYRVADFEGHRWMFSQR